MEKSITPGDELDHFIIDPETGKSFAGRHLIAEMWGVAEELLIDKRLIEATLKNAAEAAHATLLQLYLTDNASTGGISGSAILAESHITVHTHPKHGYAAVDIFMCGEAVPEIALETLREAFRPKRIEFETHKRGVVEDNLG